MKSLIILAALVAIACADGSVAEFQSCLKEGIAFKQCIQQHVNETMHENFRQLKSFKEAISKCFEQDGVKGVCVMPTPPPGFGHFTPPAHFPTPSPQFATCIDGAKNAFVTCFKKEAGIPEGFTPEGLGEPPHPPPFMGPPHFSHDLEDIKKKVLEVCGGNQDAASKLETCAKGIIKPFLPALIAVSQPILVACNAAAACQTSQPISPDCKTKLQQGAKAFCSCRQEFPKFIESSTDCAAAREAFEQHKDVHVAAVKSVEGTADAHHDIPHHPHEQFDFCAHQQDHQSVCKDLQEKLGKAHAAFGHTTPAPSS